MSQRSVVQLIKRQAIHLAPSASVREAAQLMSEKHNGALLVMDEGRLSKKNARFAVTPPKRSRGLGRFSRRVAFLTLE